MKKKIIIIMGIIIAILLILLVVFVMNNRNNPQIKNDFSVAIVRKNKEDNNLTYIVMDLNSRTYSLYEIVVIIHEDDTFTSSNNLLKSGSLEEETSFRLDQKITASIAERDNYNEIDLKHGKGPADTFYIVYQYKGFVNGTLEMDYKGVIVQELEELKELFKA